MYLKAKGFSKAFLCVAGTILIILAGLLPTVSAAVEGGSLTLICKSEGESYTNVKWSIYKVAERQSDGKLALYGDFADYPVSLEDTSVSGLQDAADTLENYAVLDNLTPISSAITDENGKLVFNGLGTGIYLISGEPWIVDNIRHLPSPMLIEFSEGEEADLTVYPKFKLQEIPDTDVEYTVRKRWFGDENYLGDRPSNIKVEIFRNNELVETVILDETNNWQYKWIGDPNFQWRVKETIVEKYSVIYRFNDTIYYVDNSHYSTDGGNDNREPDSSSGSGSSGGTTGSNGNNRLPQTGQLWWPVPVLAFCGLLLISIGCRLNKGKGNK